MKEIEKPEGSNLYDFFNIEFVARDAKEQDKTKQYKEFYEKIKSDKKKLKIATFMNDGGHGELEGEFKDFIRTYYKDSKLEDCTNFFEEVTMNKSVEERLDISKAGMFSTILFRNAIDRIEQIIDEELQWTHEKLSNEINELIDKESFMNNFANEWRDIHKWKIDNSYMEIGFPIWIQSGAKIDLSLEASSNNSILSSDTIIINVATKYKDLYAFNSRTLIIDPDESQKKAYQALYELHQNVLTGIKPGAKISEVYKSASEKFTSKYPDLTKYLPKEFGFGVGCKVKEDLLLITPTNNRKVVDGYVFCVRTYLNGFNENESRSWVLIADTIYINESGVTNNTCKISSKYKEISYSIQEGNDEKEGEGDDEVNQEEGVIRWSRLREKNVRGRGEDERKTHQDELYIKKLSELKDRYEKKQIGPISNRNRVKNLNEVCSYKGENEFPEELFKLHIFVDFKRESILMPISKKVFAPIHISILKNASMNNEGKVSILRLNFHIPNSSNSNTSNHLVFPPIVGKNRIYLKEVSFKNGDGKSLPVIFKQIKDLQKKYKDKSEVEKNLKGLVKQDTLDKVVGGKQQLDNLIIRPNITGKKTVGKLEIHKNGVRFVSNKNQEVQIVFNNIKHAIFQPWDDELIVLIHFHLLNEIMVGNKKTKDVQFITEAGTQYDDLDQRFKKKMNDIDELEQEQREINLKKRLNQRFLNFVQQIETVSKHDVNPWQFDIPYKELAFYGNTGRSIVKIMPTVNCLVNLTEFPFFITTIDEIEHVHFERVMVSCVNSNIL